MTFLVGVLSFGVFVLAKVFGSSGAEEAPVSVPEAVASPSASPSPAQRVVRPTAAGVMEVQVVEGNPRALVLIVATPTGCAQKPQAITYAEGPGAVDVRVTQRRYRGGCKLKAEPVLAVTKAPVGKRTLLLNGVPWTVGESGQYEEALRAATS
ncbi:hypothetical protein [Kribbella sp. CA-293567]|uniref:hypothetical protein n=1 Tax=Kribbella sp. CA-293567 TaxID=3002436 RepID=UPI0022DD1CE3|nr:hypothetical protein [Kribbella sp. CA-293567]WBQ03372.1 hypothetical protein OX958_25765 [Kribbella sp. CA-293567]